MERMTSSLLLFTFSPVQSFIAEARRAADLYTGSQILVELAKAAADSIGWDKVIYPASQEDIPNRIVARVPSDQAAEIADKAKKALLDKWRAIADSALAEKHEIDGKQEENPFFQHIPKNDDVWKKIWSRQTDDNYLWEIYWSAAHLEGRDYKEAYQEAEGLLNAAKFNRSFQQAEEPGFKDSLSGKREALHPKGKDGREFWMSISGEDSDIAPVQIRPNGRERLDAIGVVKRFSRIARTRKLEGFRHFPSTSSVASADFLKSVESLPELATYNDAARDLLKKKKYVVRTQGKWQYDGDLFYEETLTTQRMKNDYGFTVSEKDLRVPVTKLQELYEAAKKAVKPQKDNPSARTRPSPYYAILVLDGDDMGGRIRTCGSADEHRKFSEAIAAFSTAVGAIARNNHAYVIYNGGDDVLAMTPLSTAFQFAKELAVEFKSKTGNTASAGIAITHHLSPLGAALRAAREAEKAAKAVTGKGAVCIVLHRRSGEPVQMVSKWDDEEGLVGLLIGYFMDDGCLSSKFAYDLITDARAGSALPPEAQLALIERLVKRHKSNKLPEPKLFASRLHCWSKLMNDYIPPLSDDGVKIPQGMAELGKWLSLARFVAQGGGA
jgi:CRISPR-associated protein Cmr2